MPQAWKEAEQEAGDVIEPSPASAADDRRAARVAVEMRSGVGWKGAGGGKKAGGEGGKVGARVGGGGGGDGGSGLMYDLLAVVVHRGSAYSGHYHALIRDCLQEVRGIAWVGRGRMGVKGGGGQRGRVSGVWWLIPVLWGLLCWSRRSVVRELNIGLMQSGNHGEVWVRTSGGGGGDVTGGLVTAVAIKLQPKIVTPQNIYTTKQQAFRGPARYSDTPQFKSAPLPHLHKQGRLKYTPCRC